jgi:hypothetical protein
LPFFVVPKHWVDLVADLIISLAITTI